VCVCVCVCLYFVCAVLCTHAHAHKHMHMSAREDKKGKMDANPLDKQTKNCGLSSFTQSKLRQYPVCLFVCLFIEEQLCIIVTYLHMLQDILY